MRGDARMLHSRTDAAVPSTVAILTCLSGATVYHGARYVIGACAVGLVCVGVYALARIRLRRRPR